MALGFTTKKVEGSGGVLINVRIWSAGPDGKKDSDTHTSSDQTKPTIFCIHGITANCCCWGTIAEVLVSQGGYQVMAMDLKGRGQSDKPPQGYSICHHVEDVECVLKNLGLDRVVLMGHSLGAYIALGHAAEYPLRIEKLVLVDGAGDLSTVQMDGVQSAIQMAFGRLGKTHESADAYIENVKTISAIQPWIPLIEEYYRYELEETKGGVCVNIALAHMQEEADNMRKTKCSFWYPKVQAPTLVLRSPLGFTGPKDLLLPEEPSMSELMSTISNVKRFDVESMNHYGIVFQPHADRDKTLMDFIRGSNS